MPAATAETKQQVDCRLWLDTRRDHHTSPAEAVIAPVLGGRRAGIRTELLNCLGCSDHCGYRHLPLRSRPMPFQYFGYNCRFDRCCILWWLRAQQGSTSGRSLQEKIIGCTGFVNVPLRSDIGLSQFSEARFLKHRESDFWIGIIIRSRSWRQSNIRRTVLVNCTKYIAERRIHVRTAPNRKRQPPARTKNTSGLCYHLWWIWNVRYSKPNCHGIE